MSQIEENKQIDEMLKNTNLNYTHSLMGEQQGLLEEMFDNFSTTTYDAMGTPGTAPQNGRCWKLRAPGLD